MFMLQLGMPLLQISQVTFADRMVVLQVDEFKLQLTHIFVASI